jgi:H(+)-transporting ATP synthase subunit D
MFHIKKFYKDYKTHRRKFLNLYRKAMIKLNESYKETGKNNFILISQISKIQYKPSINIKYTKKIGIIVPQIDYELIQEKNLPAYSFEKTSHFLDDLIILFKVFFENLILLAEKEDMMLKFSYNFKKINRRINGLKNIIIPNLELDIKQIKEILEEIDRENFVRLKKTKDLIKKKHKIIQDMV